MKYDCSKTLDCIHEYNRLCEYYGKCTEGCFLAYDRDCTLTHFTADQLIKLQEWSDTHPETFKLTRKEHMFLTSFRVTSDKKIERHSGHLFLVQGYTMLELEQDMFSFINENESWLLSELSKLEVQLEEK